MRIRLCLTGILICISCLASFAQQTDQSVDKLASFPNKLFAKISSKTAHLDDQLTKQTEKYLTRLARKERNLQEKLYKTDSNIAKSLFAGTQDRYQQLTDQLKGETGQISKPLSGDYLPYIDSLKGSLSFLSQNQQLLNGSPQLQGRIAASLQQFNQLQNKLQQTEQIKAYIRERKQQLKDALSRYTGFNKYLADYNKQVYYYSTQVKEYKDLLNDPDKLTSKALSLLTQLPAFQNFMKSAGGQLAGLFHIPDNYGSPEALVGLQTREQVQQMLQGQINAGGSGGMAAFQQNLQDAHQQLDQLKDKLSKLGAGSADIDMPEFKPNQQKTRPFLKRLEIGFNLQTSKNSYYMPTTTDFGLSLGYKLDNRITAGTGISYKLGWGEPIQHITFTSEGIGLRAFFCDVKLKGSFYGTAAWEYNYQHSFSRFQQISSLRDWTASVLIGITKMVSFNGKLVKKTKVQLLFDAMAYFNHTPVQLIKFRVGYNF